MNRRGLLKALGLGVAALPTIGPAQAAKAVGLDMGLQSPLTEAVEGSICRASGPVSSGWWGSPLQISIDARQHSAHTGGARYQHMKSWARHYRESAEARDHAAMTILRHQLESDETARAKMFALLTGRS